MNSGFSDQNAYTGLEGKKKDPREIARALGSRKMERVTRVL